MQVTQLGLPDLVLTNVVACPFEHGRSEGREGAAIYHVLATCQALLLLSTHCPI